VPDIVLARAKAVLALLEDGHGPLGDSAQTKRAPQLEMFATRPPAPSPVEATLSALDVDNMTPMQALVALSQLKALLK
jgi:DNA mismatch repair ATPase MutS